MPDRLLRSRADVVTEAPARYAKQLMAHLGRKLVFTSDGATSTTTIGTATARITVGDGVLTLHAAGHDEPSLNRAQDVLGKHLERFGQRQELTVTWIRTTDTVAGPTDTQPHPQEEPS
ncbi:DUF2218 domain-containing protein [Streptomyces sp. TP-A0874]|uniref:DUF2218 domain-containing protein n=1 Tax=Streptomyces sp. TP-A0874 TaxID=549819 RepID=UPI00085374B7|nr:DUF2218 domain-containing protein [Streptomyces sp. TP-A0874]